MPETTVTLFGLYELPEGADEAVAALRSGGFAGAHIAKGGILVSVRCDSAESLEHAKDILKHAGADDIFSTAELSLDLPKPQAAEPSPLVGLVEE